MVSVCAPEGVMHVIHEDKGTPGRDQQQRAVEDLRVKQTVQEWEQALVRPVDKNFFNLNLKM